MSLSGVYRIVNRINGKIFVAASIDLFRQKNNHLTDLKNGDHPNSQLQSDFDSFGAKVFFFEVLENSVEHKDLSAREQFHIDSYDWADLYNVDPKNFVE